MIVGVHITHGISWHGHIEEWDTVYHYDTPTIDTQAGWQDLVNAIVAIERPLFSGTTSFIRARVHGPTDQTKVEDVMQYVGDLTGFGTATAGFTVPPEMAVVARMYMGRGPKGGKQILKKFWHGAAIEGTGVNVDQSDGRAAIVAAGKAKFITAFSNLKVITIGAGANSICNEQGKHLPSGTTPTVLDYVVTRQFKRGRKEKPAA